MNGYDLEDRLIDFAVTIIKVAGQLPHSYTGRHLGRQIVRSGTSPALNYGEAQSAESRKDFIHKMKIVLKELRETYVNLKIIKRSNLLTHDEFSANVMQENNELISIFVKSIQTARMRRTAE
jgi:four helix bundle protein